MAKKSRGKKNKVPKRIAGVKLPKPLRRGLKDLAASQTGRTVLIDALTAAGAALAATQALPGSKTRRLAAEKGPNVAASAKAARRHADEARAATVSALLGAARSFTEALKGRGASDSVSPTTPPTASTH